MQDIYKGSREERGVRCGGGGGEELLGERRGEGGEEWGRGGATRARGEGRTEAMSRGWSPVA